MADIEKKKYITDKGNIFNVKMDDFDAVQTVAGEQPAGEETESMTILISKSNREFGIRPRLAIYGRPLGAPNEEGARYVNQSTAYKRIAVLTPDRYNELDIDSAPDVVIGGVTFTFKGKLPELVK